MDRVMPRKKLTLSVEEQVIERAKQFAERQGTSVSELVTRFLGSLSEEADLQTAIVGRLRGVLKQPGSLEDYHRHLGQKYRG